MSGYVSAWLLIHWEQVVTFFLILAAIEVVALSVIAACWAAAAVRRASRLVRLILTRDVDRVVLDARAGVSA